MGIFYMQHWINTVKLLGAIEQACLFLKEIEKMGSFMCWIAQVISFAYMSLLNLRCHCCFAIARAVLQKSNDNSHPRKWQLHLWTSAARNTCGWHEEGHSPGEEGARYLRCCVVVPPLHNVSAALPAAASPGTARCACRAGSAHHVMQADRSYLPCLVLNQSLAPRGHSEDVINRVCNCCSLVTAGNLAPGEITFLVLLVLYGNSAVFKAHTSKTLRFYSFASSSLPLFIYFLLVALWRQNLESIPFLIIENGFHLLDFEIKL